MRRGLARAAPPSAPILAGRYAAASSGATSPSSPSGADRGRDISNTPCSLYVRPAQFSFFCRSLVGTTPAGKGEAPMNADVADLVLSKISVIVLGSFIAAAVAVAVVDVAHLLW
jgi:hypothetical protein